MDLGLDFEDSDFVKEEKPRPLLTSYNAKICSSEWFLAESADNEQNDKATLYKFRGDYHYRLMDYCRAIECYTISLSNLGIQNRTMRREVTESLARCHTNLGKTDKALELSDQVMDDCLTKDQTIQSLILKQHIYRRAGLVKEEIRLLYRLIHVHPRNVQFWSNVKQVFETIQGIHSKKQTNRSSCELSHQLMKNYLKTTEQCETVVTSNETESKTKDVKATNYKSIQNNDDEGIQGANEASNENTSGSGAILSKSSDSDVRTNIDAIELNLAHINVVSQGVDTEKCQMISNQIQHSSTSSTDKPHYEDMLTGLSCHLLILTCCIRIRLILQSVQGTVGSFIKEKNLELQKQIDRQISTLDVNEDTLQRVTEFMKRDMFEDDYSENNSTENEDKEIPTLTTAEFNRRWFSWIQDT